MVNKKVKPNNCELTRTFVQRNYIINTHKIFEHSNKSCKNLNNSLLERLNLNKSKIYYYGSRFIYYCYYYFIKNQEKKNNA